MTCQRRIGYERIINRRKAKRYDEALAMAKECITYISDEAVNKYMLNMFPELNESEDEKMRKSIIYALRNGGFYDSDKTDEAIAWLEKQGEQKSSWTEDEEKNFNVCLDYILDESLKRWLIKQWRNSYDKNN